MTNENPEPDRSQIAAVEEKTREALQAEVAWSRDVQREQIYVTEYLGVVRYLDAESGKYGIGYVMSDQMDPVVGRGMVEYLHDHTTEQAPVVIVQGDTDDDA